MKALTIWQPWASLIVAGAKPFEFRKWPSPPALQGRRIVIHAGGRKPKTNEIHDLILRLTYPEKDDYTGLDAAVALPLLAKWEIDPELLPLSAGLGTAIRKVFRNAAKSGPQEKQGGGE